MTRLSRKLTVSCLVLVLAAVAAVWWARDLPRHLVAAVLENQLSARVRLESLEIQPGGHFRLGGLEIDRLRDYPFVESLRIEEVRTRGPLRDLLDTRVDRLTLVGLAARLVPAPAVEIPQRPPPIIAELILEPAEIRIAGGAADGLGDAVLAVEAVLTGLGTRSAGEVRLTARELAPAALFALRGAAPDPDVTGVVRGLATTLDFEPGEMRLEADAESSSLRWPDLEVELDALRSVSSWTGSTASWEWRATAARGRHAAGVVEVEEPGFVASGEKLSDGVWRLELEPRLPSLVTGTASGRWETAAGRLAGFEAALEGIDLQRWLPDAGVVATAAAVLRADGDRLTYEVDLRPLRVELATERRLSFADGSRLRLAGELPWSVEALRPAGWEGPLTVVTELPGVRGRWDSWTAPATLFPLKARFDGDWQGLGPWAANGALAVTPGSVGRFETAGELRADGAQPSAELSWTVSGSSLERWAEVLRQAGLTVPELGVDGGVAASGSWRGSWPRPAIQGELRLRDVVGRAGGVAVAGEAVTIEGGEAASKWSWGGRGSAIRLRSLSAAAGVGVAGTGVFPLTLTAAGELESDAAGGRLEELTIASPGLGTAAWQGRWRQAPGGLEAAGKLALRDVDLGAWQRTLPAAASPVLGDLTIAGSLAAELDTELGESGDWRLEGPLRLGSAGFASDDGSRVMEGLAGEGRLTANGGPNGSAELHAEGRLGGFVLLWQTFFGDFSQVDAALDVRAARERATREQPSGTEPSLPWRIEGNLELPEGPRVSAMLEGSEATSALRYSLTLTDPDVASTHGRYLATALEERFGRLELGGSLAAEVRGHTTPADGERSAVWSLAGKVALEDVDFRSRSGQTEVAGLRLEMPLDLRRRQAGDAGVSGPRLGGRLAFERVSLRGLDLPPTDSLLWVEADSVGLEESIALSILGGAVTLERLSLNQVLRPERHLQTALRLSDIELAKVSEALGLFPLEGALDGYLPSARLTPARLRVEGGGEVQIFGGTVRLRDISGRDVLTRFPKLELSADLEDIDLGQLTRRIDFGEMTGLLRGTIEDCELFRGVPVRFGASFETVTRKGVPRTVDVKAINNLTILGTGQRSNVFDRGIQRFFKRYTYDRLGVELRLDDDVLLMRGLEHRGDKELFLSGRLPFRIDVVNAQPGKTVSFQAMMRRLRSLDFANVTSDR